MNAQVNRPERLEEAGALADRVGVSAGTIRLWARRGWIPSVRITHKVVRFHWPDVLAALRDRGQSPRGGR
jgi:DNA-binding transcriptional MerR regulator